MSWFVPPKPLLPELIRLNGRWQANKAALVDGEGPMARFVIGASRAEIASACGQPP